ncbi:MAG TPA: penicillin-insensitive murein endopeptidase [Gammaproteobacteria bacterium]
MILLNRHQASLPRAGLRLVLGTASLWLACTLHSHAWDNVDGPAAGEPEAIGRYAAGCVIGAARLPPDGRGYQAIRLERNRHYGHPELVRFVESLAQQTDAAGLGLLPVGDMSQPRGGPMIDDHASHQAGLDVDIFFRLDLPRLPQGERGEALELPGLVNHEQRQLDPRFGDAHVELLRLAASEPNVARIFVNPLIKQAMCERQWQDRGFLRRLRPWFGHADHMHVRLNCPPASADCISQAEPSPGDGCGAELVSWLEGGRIPSRAPGERLPPDLPMRCETLR